MSAKKNPYGPKHSHHARYLVSFAFFYLGIGFVTLSLPPHTDPFPDFIWIILTTINFIFAIAGARNPRWRRLAFGSMVIVPTIRVISYFVGIFLIHSITPFVAIPRIIAYSGLIANHYFAASRPDYNIFISNVLKHSDTSQINSLPPGVLRKLRDMVE